MEAGIIPTVMDLVHLQSAQMENAKLSMELQNVFATMASESIPAVTLVKSLTVKKGMEYVPKIQPVFINASVRMDIITFQTAK